jgi:ASC-1-like (ASCH) protein
MNAVSAIKKLTAHAPDLKSVQSRLALPKPRPIALYDNEVEIFRKGHVLVTDTRLAYIDPFDRMLKTYMFEHMISLDKSYYRGSAMNRRICKILLLAGFVILLLTFILDLLDTTSKGFVLVYLPALLSMLIGGLVWRDMRPKYKVEWRMRDGSIGRIATEPLFREWLTDSKRREIFMDELAQAMNQAISRKAWWPSARQKATMPLTTETELDEAAPKTRLTLVTDKYQ